MTPFQTKRGGEQTLVVLLAGYALAIHAAFIFYIPDPIFAPDSGGYAAPAIHLLFGKGFDLNPGRTPLYPLFLYGVLRISRHFLSVLLAQHLLCLATGLLTAVTSYRYLKTSRMGAAVVFFLSAALPLPTIYAHYILTENLYCFLLALWLFVFLFTRKQKKAVAWIMMGSLIPAIALCRPVGRSLIAVLLLLPLLEFRPYKQWRNWLWSLFSIAFLLMAFSSWNYYRHGFWGLDQIGNTSMFSHSLQYLDPNQIEDSHLRNILKPFYEHDRDYLKDGEWVYAHDGGPVKTLNALYPPNVVDLIYGHLTLLAIKNHPWRYLYDRCRLTVKFLIADGETPLFFRIPETSFFVYQGLSIYQTTADGDPRAWALWHYGPAQAKAYFSRMHFVPTGRPSGNLPFVPESNGDVTYHFNRVLSWWKPINVLIDHTQWIPVLALLSAFFLLKIPDLRVPVQIMLLICFLHALTTSMAAWQDDTRYFLPVFPLMAALFIRGIEFAAGKARTLRI